MRPRLLISIDPSLTCSGWAAFGLSTKKVIAYGHLAPPGPKLPLEFRLRTLQRDINNLFNQLGLCSEDLVVTEGPATLVKNPNSSMKLEQVRSLFEILAREFSATVLDRINPRTVQQQLLLLKGPQAARKEVKEQATAVAKRLYPEVFNQQKPKQDVVDALLIGTLALNKYQREKHVLSCASS